MVRIFFSLITLFLVGYTIPILAAVGDSFSNATLKFTVTNESPKECEVTKLMVTNYQWNIAIPSTINEYSVTSIGNRAFQGCSSLPSITIPNSVTSIGEYAFDGCSSLTSINIPDSVTVIHSYSFNNCSSLTTIIIPDSVTSIESYAFASCFSLTSINIPNRVTAIGQSAFSNCSHLTSAITIPNGVTSIEENTFYWCYSLTSITIPDNLTRIRDSAFEGCNRLAFITIPNNVTSIGGKAFRGCSSLTSITIPKSVTYIGGEAFSACSSLTSIIVESGNNYYDSRNSCNAIIKTSTNTLIQGCRNTIIPNSVTGIGGYAFNGCSSLTSISIPNSVTRIDDDAFNGCSSLTSISIPNSVTRIGWYAFNGCSSLTSISIPNSVTMIGGYAFSYCKALTSIIISNEVKEVPTGAFQGCYSLKKITIPNSVTLIGDEAFYGCSSLTSVTIPNSVTSIGYHAFDYTALYNNQNGVFYVDNWVCGYKGTMPENTMITLKEGSRGIATSAFKDCTSLISITLPNSVTSIENYAFYGCSSLTSITIPNGVRTISYYSFSGCTSLISITLPNSVTSIESYAFYGCSSLTSITIPESVTYIDRHAFDNTAWYNNQVDGVVYAGNWVCGYKGTMPENTMITLKEGTRGIAENAFHNCSSLKAISIPNSVIAIGNYAFENCTSLSSITIPNGVMTISKYSFRNCISLISVTLPNSVTSIGSYAFENCSSLTSITIPNNVTSIGEYAFAGCSSLTSITIPNSVTSIVSHAFYNCSSLTSITISSSVTTIGEYVFSGCSSLSSIIIPNSVTSIGEYAFCDCSSLSSITIPNSVTSIDRYAFADCSSLTSITLPNSVSSIGESAFYGCSSLTSITIPNSVISIVEYVFRSCSSLTSITIPNSVTSIGEYAFQNCSSLTSINIPNSVISIGEGAFYDCSSLTSIIVESGNTVYDSRDHCNAIIESMTNSLIIGCKNTTIPNSVTSIGDNAFFRCSNLTAITIPNSVTSIGERAFYGCPSLMSITIPNSVTSIGKDAFYLHECKGHVVRSHIQVPFPVSGDFSSRHLYVPIGKVELYKSTPGWLTSNIKEMTALMPEILINDSTATITTEDASAEIYYTLDGSEPDRNSMRYETPFQVNPNVYNIKAIAVGDDMYDSPINYLVKGKICSMPTLHVSVNGITMKSPDNATIYYTTDGSTPNKQSTIYSGLFQLDEPCTIKAIAIKDGYNNSSVISLTITSAFKDHTLQVAEAGIVNEAIDFWGLQDIDYLSLTGTMNQNDITAFQQLTSIKHLDLSQSAFDGERLPDDCFAALPLTSIFIPKNVTAGKYLFADCPNLAAIVWNDTQIPAEALAGINNPNLLLYVEKEEDAVNVYNDGIRNIVVNGMAKDISLSDIEEGNYNFYSPQLFTAESISYTHDYQLPTGIHECKGWETIALPFDVETVTHEMKGVLTAAAENDPTRPLYWLYEYTEDGFVPAANIKANTPYIISMPNNPAYSEEYQVNGSITFSASHTSVPATELHHATKGAITFIPCFERVAPSPYIFVMNQQGDYATIPAGSIFLPDKHEVRPFKAYATTNLNVKSISLFEDETTPLREVKNERMKSEKGAAVVYDLSGRKMANRGIQRGVYIRDHKQIIIQ